VGFHFVFECFNCLLLLRELVQGPNFEHESLALHGHLRCRVGVAVQTPFASGAHARSLSRPFETAHCAVLFVDVVGTCEAFAQALLETPVGCFPAIFFGDLEMVAALRLAVEAPLGCVVLGDGDDDKLFAELAEETLVDAGRDAFDREIVRQ
jgi:hypothetical protein